MTIERGPETLKLRVFDSTQATIIAPDFITVDTARDPFHVVARDLVDVANCGVCLNPFRGIPQVSRIPDVDIVFLDEHHRVLQLVEHYKHETGTLAEVEANSALVLPAAGVRRSRIRLGDQLRFNDAETGQPWADEIAGAAGDGPVSASISQAEPSAAAIGIAQPETPTGPESQVKSGSSDGTAPSALSQEPRKSGLGRAIAWLLGKKQHPSDRRKGERRAIPGLVAYFWTGGPPQPQQVSNISTEGFYLLTEERWTPGTRMLVSLQIVNAITREVEAMISVPSKVVWSGSDGIGFAFDSEPSDQNRGFTVASPDELFQVERFLQRLKE